MVGVACVAAAWLGIGRPVSRVARFAGRDFRVPVEVTEDHIRWFRDLRIAWSFPIEGGGPMVDPVAPYGLDRGMPSMEMHREVCDLLVWLLAHRPLAPGSYPLAYLDRATLAEIVRVELASLRPEWLEEIGDAAEGWPLSEGMFDFSDQHARLLPGLAWEWPDLEIAPLLTRRTALGAPVPVVDFKRPFGDATAFELDMAALLGFPEAPEDYLILFTLYEELWPALQVYVQNVPLDVGPLSA